MLNLLLCDKVSLENLENQPYTQMAFDGMFFYCCTGKTCKIYKLDLNGKLIRNMDTKRVFRSICYDCKEKCFWAMVPNCFRTIFKLDSSFCEIARFSIPCQGSVFMDISYSAIDDMLLLCGGKTVIKLSKNGTIFPIYSGERNSEFDVVTGAYSDIFIGCKFKCNCPNIIGVIYPNYCFDYVTCTPKKFSLNSMCVGYGRDCTATLFALVTQNYCFSYLLKYKIESSDNVKPAYQQTSTSCCNDDKESVNVKPAYQQTSTSCCNDDKESVNVYVECSDVHADIMLEVCEGDEIC